MTRSFLLVFLSFFYTLQAQEVATVTIRVLCLERDSTVLDKLSVMTSDKEYEQISFPETFPSRSVKASIINGKVIFFNPKNTDAPPVATASIPSSWEKGFILFLPLPEVEGEPLYRTVVLETTPQDILGDGALVINLCDKELQVLIGEHEKSLPAGESAKFPRPEERNDFNMTSVVFLQEEDSEWKVQSENTLRFPEDQLQLFVAFPDSKLNKIQYRVFDLSEY